MTSNPSRLYSEQYLGAVQLMKDEKFQECVQEAEYNLTDPTLPRYYRCKNLILIASISHDWYKAENRRRKAEEIWQEAEALTHETEIDAMDGLSELRESLDDVKANLEANWPDDFEEEYVYEDDAEEEGPGCVDETRVVVRLEDTEAVHRAEEEVFGSEANIIRHYEEAAAAGRAARLERIAQEERAEQEEIDKKVEELRIRETQRREEAFAEAARRVKAAEESREVAENAKAAEEAAKAAADAKGKRAEQRSMLPVRSRSTRGSGYLAPTAASKHRARSADGRR